jgi:hypothetical protein
VPEPVTEPAPARVASSPEVPGESVSNQVQETAPVAARSASGANSAVSTAPKEDHSVGSKWTMGVGVAYQHWGSQVAGSLGPTVDATWALSDRFRIHGAIRYQWALGRAQGFSAEEAGVGMHAGVALLPGMDLLLGPVLAVSSVSGDTAATSRANTSVEFGGELLLQGRFPRLGPGAYAEVGMRRMLESIQVELNGESALTIPGWRFFVGTGFRFGGPSTKAL